MKTLAEQIAGKCVHFNGLSNDRCKVGIAYEQFRIEGSSMLTTSPCFKGGTLHCDKQQFPTEDEVLDQIRNHEECWEKIKKARAEIVAVTKGQRGRYGSVECPNCDGMLNFSVAKSNGHIHAKCSGTCGVAWME